MAMSEKDIVETFFPQSLIDESVNDFGNREAPTKIYHFVTADLNGDGTLKFIVAVYTSGFRAIIRVLEKKGDSAVLVNEPNIPFLGGSFPKITLMDMDNDSRPEVIVSLSAAGSLSSDWVFKWDGASLYLFGPSTVDQDGNATTDLQEAYFIDLDGDGRIDILNPSGDGSADIYTLQNGEYTFSRSLAIMPENFPPNSQAGNPQDVYEATTVSLDGTRSSDPEGRPLTFAWTQTAGPVVTLNNANSTTPTFTASAVTTDTVLTFQLVVSDGELASMPSTVNVTVRPIAQTPPAQQPPPDNPGSGQPGNNNPGTPMTPGENPQTPPPTGQDPTPAPGETVPPPDNTPTTSPQALQSDLDGSGRVDGFDLSILGRAFGSRPGDRHWNPRGDLNGDGIVNAQDRDILQREFGHRQ